MSRWARHLTTRLRKHGISRLPPHGSKEAWARQVADQQVAEEKLQQDFEALKSDFLRRMADSRASLTEILCIETTILKKRWGQDEWRTQPVSKAVWAGPPGLYVGSDGFRPAVSKDWSSPGFVDT